jgi:hypothetical protein
MNRRKGSLCRTEGMLANLCLPPYRSHSGSLIRKMSSGRYVDAYAHRLMPYSPQFPFLCKEKDSYKARGGQIKFVSYDFVAEL